jgi:hypothetical protein
MESTAEWNLTGETRLLIQYVGSSCLPAVMTPLWTLENMGMSGVCLTHPHFRASASTKSRYSKAKVFMW